MPSEADSTHGFDQTKIWRHFQNAGQDSFQAARPRAAALIRTMARKACGTRPSVLNIGIGDGTLERLALLRGWDIHALDPDAQGIAKLAEQGVPAQVGVIEKLPYDDARFEFVVASEVLEHLTDEQRQAGLLEISRVLRPGGWFLGTVPFAEDLSLSQTVCPHCGLLFHRWGHHRSFTAADVTHVLSAHFVIESIRVTAFVAFRDRSLFGKLKSLARWVLAKARQMIAVPSLFWIVRKPQ